MGSEQSTPRRDTRPNREGIPQAEVNRLLEQQKRDYERKLKEARISQAQARIGASSPHNPHIVPMRIDPATWTNNVDGQARARMNDAGSPHIVPMRLATEATQNVDGQMDQIRSQIQELIAISSSSGRQTPANNRNDVGTPRPNVHLNNSNTTPNATFQRDRVPHSFSFANNNSPNNLYPNLDVENSNLSSQTNAPTERISGPSRTSADSRDYVFVNKPKAQAVQSYNCRPSAPPLPSESSETRPSTSRSNSNKDKDDELNCITCGNKYGLTIFQCPGGHSSCRDCKIFSTPCGRCGGTITDMHNYTLEAYVAEVKLAACVTEAERKTRCPLGLPTINLHLKQAERKTRCPNADSGCNLHLKLADIESHKKECPFGEFVCPISQNEGRCNWKGKSADMTAHFDRVHPANRQAQVDTELSLISITNNSLILHLVEIGTYNFLVHLKVDANLNKIFMAVQLIGTQMSASKWTYELQIYNKREPRRKMSFTGICSSHAISVDDIYAESQCVVIAQDYAATYVNGRFVNYKFYIRKDSELEASCANQHGVRPTQSRGRGRGRGRGRMNNNN